MNLLLRHGNIVADHSLHSPHSAARANFVGEHSGLVLPYRVKQAVKRQAKQCTALFCTTPPINN
jgi:hypothetical protein